MIRIVIGAAEQSIAYDLRAALTEMEGVDALFVVESTTELAAAVLRLDPDVVLVHDRLGPEPVLQFVRDLSLRKPGCAALLVTLSPTPDQLADAMDAGTRGVVPYPVTLEQLLNRILAAGEWAQQMRRMLTAGAGTPGLADRARVVTFTGVKGGTGTTTVATHIALDVVRNLPGHRVCLVDLDLEKGDLAGILEVRHRASVADVAKVSADLSPQAVADAVVAHETGVHLLLAPEDLLDVESVTPQAIREVLAVLRSTYDLVVIDAGSHVTPVQATVVELADEVVAVTTPDVLALRGLRRTVTQWETLGVRKEPDVRVLVNRLSRSTTVSLDTVRQLTRAQVVATGLPAMFRRLEPAVNARDPLEVQENGWWRALRAVGREAGLVRTAPDAVTPPAPARSASRWRRGPRADAAVAAVRDAGSVAVETVGVLPILVLVVAVMWQVGLYGMSMVWSGRAAGAAARAESVRQEPGLAARESVPTSVADDLTVRTGASAVTVDIKVPMFVPGLPGMPGSLSATRAVVLEP